MSVVLERLIIKGGKVIIDEEYFRMSSCDLNSTQIVSEYAPIFKKCFLNRTTYSNESPKNSSLGPIINSCSCANVTIPSNSIFEGCLRRESTE